MARFPSADDINRRVPTARSSVLSYDTSYAGRAEQAAANASFQASKTLSDVSVNLERQQEERDRLDALKAESYALQKLTEVEERIRREPDYTQYQKMLDDGFSEIRKNTDPLLSSPRQKEILDLGLQKMYFQQKSRVDQLRFDKEKEYIRADGIESYNQRTNAAVLALQHGNIELAQALVNSQLSDNKARFDAQAYSPEEFAVKQIKDPSDMISAALDSLSPQEALEYVSEPSGSPEFTSFEGSVDYVIDQLERTPEVTPDGKGNVRWGINDYANKDVDLSNLTRDGAVKIYKERYWDAIAADSLPEDLRFMAFDSAVVQGVPRTKQWLKEANGDAEKFIRLRKQGFESIGGKNLPGWINRLDKVRSVSGLPTSKQGLAARLPADSLNKLRNGLLAEAQKPVKEKINSIEQAISLGRMVDHSDIEQTALAAERYQMPDQAEALRDIGVLQEDVNVFARQNLKEQAETIKDLQKSRDLEDNAHYKAYASVYENKLKMIKSEAMDYYAGVGVIDEPTPLDFTGDISSEIDARRLSVDRIKELEGFNVSLLRNAEIEQIKEIAMNGTKDEKGVIISKLGQFLTDDERRAAGQALHKDAPKMAVALTLPLEDATLLFEGEQAEGEVGSDKIRAAVNEKIQGTVFDAEALEGIQGSIYDMYKALSINEGDSSKNINDKRLEKAIEKTIGKPVTISPGMNATRVFTYKDASGEYVKQSRLEDILGRISDDAMLSLNDERPYTSDGLPVSADDIERAGEWVNYGDGTYIIHYKNLGDLRTKDGKLYVIDARALERLQRQNPELIRNPSYIGTGVKYSIKEGF